MSDSNLGDNGHDSEFDTCVEAYLRDRGEHASWNNASDELLEQAIELAEKELGRKRRS